MKWADFASCQAEITALMNDRINQVPSAAKFHWHLHRVGFHHTSRHLLRSTGRGEGVALHPTLGYFYSWERRWWTWTRGLEAFPRQFTKAVKPELELTRPQIPRSAAPNVSLALNLQGPCAPERNFPGSAQVEFFCTQIKSLSQIPVFSTSAGTWNRYSKLISISSPPGGHNLRGYRQGSGTERPSMTCKSFACPDARLLENTRSSQDLELCWFPLDDDGSLENRFQVSCMELPRSYLLDSFSPRSLLPKRVEAEDSQATQNGSLGRSRSTHAFPISYPIRVAMFRNQIGHCWQL